MIIAIVDSDFGNLRHQVTGREWRDNRESLPSLMISSDQGGIPDCYFPLYPRLVGLDMTDSLDGRVRMEFLYSTDS